MNETEICYLSAAEMARAIRAKKLSTVEITGAVLNRIERINPKINAYCTIVAESAIKQAKQAEAMVTRGEKLGPLHGVPVSIKDLIFTQGIRTTAGSRIYQDFVPQQDAIAVERLKAAGAIIIGKTNTAEFGWVAITDNELFGLSRNPWNLDRTPGGSSGGAAASVASGIGPVAMGSDGGGSIRIPGSFCGVFGFKPSFGRVPQHAEFPGWETLSHTGPITRTVEDAALTMEVIAGRDDRDPASLPDTGLRYLPFPTADLTGLKIAWSPDLGYITVDHQIRQTTEAAAKAFASLGAAIEVATPAINSPESAFSTIVSARMATVFGDKMAEWEEQMAPALARFIQRSSGISATQYIEACFEQRRFWQAIQPFFEKYDLLLTPTAAAPPFEHGILGPREIDGKNVGPLEWMAFTYPFNLTGQPAASVPCGWTDDGLPIGLQIIGRRFDDATVLKAAHAFEQTSPWTDKKPPLG
ncbi:amidase [Bacteroidota bacterium]